MNKSQRFILNCIKDGRCSDEFVADEFKNDSFCYKPFDVLGDDFKKIVKNNSFDVVFEGTTQAGIDGKSKITITYNPFAEFQYFTSDVCVHDGTLLFLKEAIANIFKNILSIGTYYSPNAPEDFANHVWDYDYEYIIGDFVINNQINPKYAPNDKPWLMEKQIVCLPIKMKFIKKSGD